MKKNLSTPKKKSPKPLNRTQALRYLSDAQKWTKKVEKWFDKQFPIGTAHDGTGSNPPLPPPPPPKDNNG